VCCHPLQLADVGRRMQEPQSAAAPDHHNLLKEAQQVFRDDAVEYTRICAWLDVSSRSSTFNEAKSPAQLHLNEHLNELCMEVGGVRCQ
jgi:hypothetical protein